MDNECVICQTVGYKPNLPENIYPGVLAQNIRKIYTCVKYCNRGITDFERIIPELMKYKTIYELDLSGNKIRTLPKNLTFLKNLEVLDLSGNPIHNVSRSI